MNARPEELGIIAGSGAYPRLLAESAKKQGVRRVHAVCFTGETDRDIRNRADETTWVRLGRLDAFLEAVAATRIRQFVMVGQIKPTHLFHLRLDTRMLALLARLPRRNAETIFGAIGEELRGIGVELLPAWQFMESSMPAAGQLGGPAPTEAQRADVELGLRVAKVTSGLDVGQTVVVKQGTILAIEAFEGTNEAIRRGAKLGGPGAAVVKVAKKGHDMRFDIPVIGEHTFKVLKEAKAGVLAVEAGRTILLEREKLVAVAAAMGLSFVAVDAGD